MPTYRPVSPERLAPNEVRVRSRRHEETTTSGPTADMGPIVRFSGVTLEDALRSVRCTMVIAAPVDFANAATPTQLTAVSTIIHKGHPDNWIYVLLFAEGFAV